MANQRFHPPRRSATNPQRILRAQPADSDKLPTRVHAIPGLSASRHSETGNAVNDSIVLSQDLSKMLEDIKANRQDAQTMFQEADQRTTQSMNILATILKTLQDERNAIDAALH